MSDFDGDATATDEAHVGAGDTTTPRHVVMLNRRDEQGLMHPGLARSSWNTKRATTGSA